MLIKFSNFDNVPLQRNHYGSMDNSIIYVEAAKYNEAICYFILSLK